MCGCSLFLVKTVWYRGYSNTMSTGYSRSVFDLIDTHFWVHRSLERMVHRAVGAYSRPMPERLDHPTSGVGPYIRVTLVHTVAQIEAWHLSWRSRAATPLSCFVLHCCCFRALCYTLVASHSHLIAEKMADNPRLSSRETLRQGLPLAGVSSCFPTHRATKGSATENPFPYPCEPLYVPGLLPTIGPTEYPLMG